MLLVLLPLCAQDPPPQKKGGGGAPQNLKVLTPEELRSGVMPQYVAAQGVGPSGGCYFCHVQGNRASDDKPEKVTARAMISMVKDINAKLTAANLKPAVTCYTCHRGKTEPENAAGAGQP